MTPDELGVLLERFRGYATVTSSTYQRAGEESGKELLGFTLGDVPRELIHAAGFQPVGVIGWAENINRGVGSLPSFCCSLMRTTLEMGLAGATEPLQGLVLGHICDTTRDFTGVWQKRVPGRFFHDWLPPKQVGRPSARVYALGELERLRDHLASFSGHPVRDDQIAASIDLYEKQRQLLFRLKTHLRDGNLAALDFFSVCKSALLIEPERFNQWAGRLADLLNVYALPEEIVSTKMPVVVSGKIAEPLAIMGVVDRAGALVVDDDFLWGSRLIRQCCPEGGAPMERLVSRLLASEPFPGYLYETPVRRNFIDRLVRESGSSGVIFWDLKFCETYNFDYPDLERFFADRGVATLHLETEMQGHGLGQIETRVQAFVEPFLLEK